MNSYQKIIFGLKVKELRQGLGLSFAALSKKTKMSISYLNEIEKGKKFPKQDKIETLAKTLGTSTEALLSTRMNPALMPVGDLLQSNFLSELPLHLFGIDLQKVIEMISKAPIRVGAFISTLVELSRNYALQEENFYFGAMRAYQELHNNYFKEIEDAAERLIIEHKLKTDNIHSKDLIKILENDFNCKVNFEKINEIDELKNIHSIYVNKKNSLFLHKKISEAQLSLLVGREIGFRYLQLKERPLYTPIRVPQSFEPVLSNFKATYFATALMMNKNHLAEDVAKFCSNTEWKGDVLLDMIKNYNVTPEMAFHRLTHILPEFFKLKQLFFIRVRTELNSNRYTIDKVLHLNKQHHAHSNKIYEHYCRRWLSVEILKELQELRNQGKEQIIAKVQKSLYHGTNDEYLTLSLGIPAGSLQDKDISVTLGILMDDHLKKVIKFAFDPKIPLKIVNKTCERCPIIDCNERVVPPSVHQQKESWKATQQIINQLVK